MKLNRKKTFCIFGCILGFSLIAGVLSYVVTQGIKKNVFAQDNITFEEVSIQSNYSAFTYFEVPTCSLVVEGNKHETSHTLILPDGSATKANALNLEDAGKYKVVYSTVYDNKVYEKVYTFSVQDALYGIENGKRNYPTYANDEFGGAINAVLSDGEVLNFYQPINLNKLNNASLIRFYNIASTPGNYDAEIVVTLTDVYNPNMNVKIRFFALTAETGFAMVHTSVNGSGWISLGVSSATTIGAVEYNGEYYTSTLNSRWGPCIQGASMNGKGREGWWFPSFTDDNPTSPWWGEDRGTSAVPMNLYFDGATNRLYFRDGYYGVENAPMDFVTDLDYQPFYGKNLKWTTGEVYLSIEGANYMNATLNLMIEDVYGLDLSKNALPDNAAPEIDIDLQGYSEDDLPKAVVGQAYNIFNATVTDKLNTDTYSSSKVELETSVYYNYYSSQKIYKQIIDGTFTPTVAGNYFIEYLSTDNFRHTAKKVLMIEAVDKVEDATLKITNKKTECEITQIVTLFDSLTVDNVFGNPFYKITVTDKNGVEYAIGDNYSFAPKSLGAYEVIIEYGGYSERYEEAYTLTLTGDGKNIYLEEPVFERYYINNATHTVPIIKVNKLTENGATEQEVCCKVIADGTTDLKVENNSFTVKATNSIVIEYYVGTEKIYSSSALPVVDVGFKTAQLEVDKYFDAVGYSLAVNTEGTTVMVKNTQAEEFTFIRPLQMASFNLSFSFNENFDNFDAFYMMLTDSINAEDKVEIKFYQKSGSYYYLIGEAMDKFDKTNIILNYENRKFKFAGKNSVSVEKYVDGRVFEGFRSGYAYLSFRFEDAQIDQASVSLIEINGQLLNARKRDDIAPQTIFTKITGSYTVGDIVTLRPIIFADVYDPSVVRNAYVMDSNGQYVTAMDGTKLDNTADYSKSYQIKLEHLGKYNVHCKATDSSGNTKRETVFSIKVVDLIAPKVSVENAVIFAKANSTVELGTLSIVDNLSTAENCIVSIYYCNPERVMKKVESKSIEVDKAGVYTIYYLVQDEANNYTEFSYNIEVE